MTIKWVTILAHVLSPPLSVSHPSSSSPLSRVIDPSGLKVRPLLVNRCFQRPRTSLASGSMRDSIT